MIDRPPEYGMTCHCGMRITGTNEKGLVSLFKKHYDTGEYHLAYELHQNHYSYRKSEQEIVIEKAILRREKKMPVPEGEITTSEILVPIEAESVEAVLAIEDDEKLVEVVEELVQDDLSELP